MNLLLVSLGLLPIVLAVCLPALIVGIEGSRNAGWTMRLVWLLSMQVQMLATAEAAANLLLRWIAP